LLPPNYPDADDMRKIQNYIERGGVCTACGARWVDAPEVGRGAREMIHRPNCRYWAKSLTETDEED